VDDIITIQRSVVDEHIREENAHNWPGVYDTFIKREHAFYDVVPFNLRFPGFTGVQDFYGSADTAFPDFQIDVRAEYDTRGCSIREIFISGTHKGEWCGVPGTGRFVRFPLAAFFLFGKDEEAGKLLAERIYFDNETILRQIRGEQEPQSLIDFATPMTDAMKV